MPTIRIRARTASIFTVVMKFLSVACPAPINRTTRSARAYYGFRPSVTRNPRLPSSSAESLDRGIRQTSGLFIVLRCRTGRSARRPRYGRRGPAARGEDGPRVAPIDPSSHPCTMCAGGTALRKTVIGQQTPQIRIGLAARVGFEPTEPVKAQRFSRPSKSMISRGFRSRAPVRRATVRRAPGAGPVSQKGGLRLCGRSREQLAGGPRHGVASSRRSGERDADYVRRDAGPTGVAADRGHRRVLTVLRSGLSNRAGPDLLHAMSVNAHRPDSSRVARRRRKRGNFLAATVPAGVGRSGDRRPHPLAAAPDRPRSLAA
jgi:hypothetical protein